MCGDGREEEGGQLPGRQGARHPHAINGLVGARLLALSRGLSGTSHSGVQCSLYRLPSKEGTATTLIAVDLCDEKKVPGRTGTGPRSYRH
jgi:hypothetical protein